MKIPAKEAAQDGVQGKLMGKPVTLAVVAVLATATAIIASTLTLKSSTDPHKIDFNRDIRPIFNANCMACHGPDPVARKAGLRLDTKEGLYEATPKRGPAVVPGDPAASLLLQAIRHDSEDLAMPKAGAKLEPGVIADFEHWIRLGAPDPRDTPPSDAQVAADTDWDAVLRRRKAWWSFQPIAKADLGGLPAGTHPIDHLLSGKLRAVGLTRAPRADRAPPGARDGGRSRADRSRRRRAVAGLRRGRPGARRVATRRRVAPRAQARARVGARARRP
ncbi:MAG: c-type cytochrome domain-containing protein, partial [Deltaproteobacteria bacterium]